MFKFKKRVTRAYVLLVICLMGTGSNYASAQSKAVQINKVVTGEYQESSNIENIDIKENKDLIGEDVKTPSNIVKETAIEPKTEETTSTESKENNSTKGTPIKAELTAYSDDPRSSGQWGSQTAMQTRTRLGVIAAPKNIPLGSKIYIPELSNYKTDGMFDVEDRGGAIKVKKDGTYVIDV